MKQRVRSVLLTLGRFPTACWVVVLSLHLTDESRPIGDGQRQPRITVIGLDGDFLGEHFVLPVKSAPAFVVKPI